MSDESLHINAAENTNTEKYLIFSVMGKYYCLPSKHIGEIALFDAVYPLPMMPPFVLGVVNRYSVPYALFDIGLLFYNTPTPRKKILVIKDEIDRIAFLIDDVSSIADIEDEKLIYKERNAESNDIAEVVLASFEWNENNVFVLDIQKIFSHVTGGSV